jgi:hypothetical protein
LVERKLDTCISAHNIAHSLGCNWFLVYYLSLLALDLQRWSTTRTIKEHRMSDFEDDDQIGKDIKFFLLVLIVVMAVAAAFWSK